MQNLWTDNDMQFLRDHYGEMPRAEIARQLGRRIDAVTQKANKLGLRTHRWFSDEDRETVRRDYPTGDTAEIAKRIGRPVSAVHGLANKLGLNKTAEVRAAILKACGKQAVESGKAHRFPKGHVPMNKGTRRPGYAAGRMAETQFKKGQRGITWKPIGSERICRKQGYILVKITEGQPLNYRAKHNIVWETANGPIPKGYCVTFKDQDKLNCELENLELITRAELMSRNTIHNFPEPVKDAIQAFGRFKRRLNTRAKKQDRGSQEHPL